MAAGFDILPTQSAICAVMLYDPILAGKFAATMAKENIFVTSFTYPVVPKGKDRIRVQLSAAHTREQLDKAIAAFIKVGKQLGVLKIRFTAASAALLRFRHAVVLNAEVGLSRLLASCGLLDG